MQSRKISSRTMRNGLSLLVGLSALTAVPLSPAWAIDSTPSTYAPIRGALAVADDRVDAIDQRLSLYRRATGGTANGMGAADPRSAGSMFTHLLLSDPSKPSSVYLNLTGIQGFRDSKGNQSGVEFNDFMAWLGADRRFGDHWTLGAAIGYGGGQAKSSEQITTADRTTQTATIYGGYERGRLFVNSDAFWAWDRYDHIDRQTNSGTAVAKANGTSWGIGVTSGMMFGLGPTRLGPVAGLRGAGAHIDGYCETGTRSNNSCFSEQQNTLLSSQLGGEVQYNHVPSGMLAPRLRVVWDRHLVENHRDINGYLVSTPGTVETIPGVKEQTDRMRVRFSLGGTLARGLSAGADYEMAVGGGVDQRLTAGLHLAF